VLVYTVLFHVIKLYLEDEQYSWITGTYWTLVVMSDVECGMPETLPAGGWMSITRIRHSAFDITLHSP
jgi:hypothetical protein